MLCKPNLLAKTVPNVVKDIQLVSGEWNTKGSVNQWKTYVSGKLETTNVAMEDIDVMNKSITYKPVDGECLNYYNTIKDIMQVKPKGTNQGSLVKWTLEYETKNDGVPPPNQYLELLDNVTKAVDAYLLNA
ncbi:MLP-like protein 31 [Quillaja saponaria]|uniref:MLP-like protein 31 n=1 Tax=Quillaja saponaria TaxID=32244 RepID=A0AAD7KP52_QUISA|nr:MLP-like protein 31 [Quillaja saponaria]